MFRRAKNSIYPKVLTGASLIGLVMMFWSTGQKIHYLNDPTGSLSCNLNPIMDCGTVINHHLSSVFGVSNSLIGTAAFAMLFALGLGLMAGVKATKRYRQMVLALVVIMFLFATWFFSVSLYIIGKICLFCLGVWVAIIPLIVLTLKEFDSDIFAGRRKMLKKPREWVSQKPYRIVVTLYVLALLLFLYRFRDYYFG